MHCIGPLSRLNVPEGPLLNPFQAKTNPVSSKEQDSAVASLRVLEKCVPLRMELTEAAVDPTAVSCPAGHNRPLPRLAN